jgi:hypothetical protein
MNAILLALRTALGIIPQVIEVIKAVELPGNGADKAKVVLGIVEAAFDLLPGDVLGVIDRNKIGAFVHRTLDLVVGLLNTAGVFKKATA